MNYITDFISNIYYYFDYSTNPNIDNNISYLQSFPCDEEEIDKIINEAKVEIEHDKTYNILKQRLNRLYIIDKNDDIEEDKDENNEDDDKDDDDNSNAITTTKKIALLN